MLADQRHLFDVPDDIAYFNTASMSPLLRSVREAGARGLAQRAAPWTISAADWFDDAERLRARFAALIGADADGVALVPATSYGLAVAARNLSADAGDEVVVLAGEFPSNFYTWQGFARRHGARVITVMREPGQDWGSATLAVIGERTRLVAVPNVHWTNGDLVDVSAIAAATRAAGAALCIDATQSLGIMPLDLETLRPDFVVAAGYKWLLGPFSVGYVYVAEQHRGGEPLEESWINRSGADDFAGVADYSDVYLPGARRFDVGQRTNFGLLPMALAALDQLLSWGVAGVADTLRTVTAEIGRSIDSLGLTVTAPDRRGPHMLGVELSRELAQRISSKLGDAGVVASVRGTSLRIAPHLHTGADDIARLIEGFAAAL